MIRASANDHDFWKQQIFVEASGSWTGLLEKVGRTSQGRQDKTKVVDQREWMRVETTLRGPQMDAIVLQPRAHKFASRTIIRQMVVKHETGSCL